MKRPLCLESKHYTMHCSSDSIKSFLAFDSEHIMCVISHRMCRIYNLDQKVLDFEKSSSKFHSNAKLVSFKNETVL